MIYLRNVRSHRQISCPTELGPDICPVLILPYLTLCLSPNMLARPWWLSLPLNVFPYSFLKTI